MMTATTMVIMTMTAMNLNPMKMCLAMMGSSFLMFTNIYMESGKTWMPMSMFMLFVGGILMMFMILSSTMPNEKMKKTMKNKKMMMILLITMSSSIMGMMTINSESEQMQQMKMFFTNQMNMPIMISIMTMYFSMFLFLLKMNKNSMRKIN